MAALYVLPDWLVKPESIFRTALWLLGPFLTWFVGRFIIRRIEAWYAVRSESAARNRLSDLYFELNSPFVPSVEDTVNRIICYLPIPCALALAAVSMAVLGYVLPRNPLNHHMLDEPEFKKAIGWSVFLLTYLASVLFATLGFNGLHAYPFLGSRPSLSTHVEKIRNRIRKIKNKFPQLENFDGKAAFSHATERRLREQKVSTQDMRARLRTLSDEGLQNFITAMRFMADSKTNVGEPQSLVYDVQLHEALDEQKHRNSPTEDNR